MKLHALTNLRNSGLHISGLMILGFISRLQERTNSAYVSEIHCYYLTESLKGSLRSYSISGIYYMVNKLKSLGYVYKSENQGFKLTGKGQLAIGFIL